MSSIDRQTQLAINVQEAVTHCCVGCVSYTECVTDKQIKGEHVLDTQNAKGVAVSEQCEKHTVESAYGSVSQTAYCAGATTEVNRIGCGSYFSFQQKQEKKGMFH